MSQFDACSAYLADATAAGHQVSVDGLACIAGRYHEPLSGTVHCLVEYADKALLTDLDRLYGGLRAAHPEARTLIVRAPAGVPVDPRLLPLQTYLRYQPDSVTTVEMADHVRLTVVESRDHDDLVNVWLVRAFTDGGTDLGRTVDPVATAEAAEAILAEPGRRSLVLKAPDGPVGHATLLTEAVDDVSGVPHVELVDALVDHAELRPAGMRSLVAAADVCARQLGLPLLGNVTHHAPGEDADSSRVLASLTRAGWRPVFAYYHAPCSGAGPSTSPTEVHYQQVRAR
ncbi:hypothetical protein [Pilimelia columellifera]|uniref:N-acetyltransferase domain-containing protein n=1 Tax=Pilimelia columellifera subsp. columellifera TaxID=706583 RepID=A0ABN3NSQ7_9ACTN